MAKNDLCDEADGLFETWLQGTGRALGLVQRIRSRLQLAKIVQQGLQPSAIDGLLKLGVSERAIFESVIPRRTYQRRKTANQTLTSDESDRTERVARLFALATLVLGDDGKAVQWLATPKQQFDRRAPLEFATSGIGTNAVEDVLLRAYYGFSA